MDGLEIETRTPNTNMVYFRLTHPKLTHEKWEAACRERGFRFSQMGENRYRAVTHLGISFEAIEHVVRGTKEALAYFERSL